jgi:hypothetical protein
MTGAAPLERYDDFITVLTSADGEILTKRRTLTGTIP